MPTPLHDGDIDRFADQMEVVPWQPPHHYRFGLLPRRIHSFAHWDNPVSKEDLARDGFFYSGIGDAVVCFYCSLGLRGWWADDDPSVVHATYSPYCTFLRQRKGRRFIDNVHRQLDDDTEVPPHWEGVIARHTPSEEQREATLTTERGLCKVCISEEINIVSLPCAHMFACVQCMPRLKECPVCRQKIQFTLRVFLS